MDGNPCLIPVSDNRKKYAVECTLRRNTKNILQWAQRFFYGSLQPNTNSANRERSASEQINPLIIHWVSFHFLSLHLEDPRFVHASSLVWVKQTSWIEQTGCISCDWQIPILKRRPTEYIIASIHVCVFLNSWGSDFVFLGTINCDRNEIKASAGKFSPDSLHITSLSLLSLRWYNPSAHRQTGAATHIQT